MVERQQVHDHKMDEATLRAENTYRTLGVYAGVTALAVLAIPAAVAFWFGHPAAGTLLGLLAGAASVAGVFVRGRNLTAMGSGAEPASTAALQPPGYPVQSVPTHAPPPPR